MFSLFVFHCFYLWITGGSAENGWAICASLYSLRYRIISDLILSQRRLLQEVYWKWELRFALLASLSQALAKTVRSPIAVGWVKIPGFFKKSGIWKSAKRLANLRCCRALYGDRGLQLSLSRTFLSLCETTNVWNRVYAWGLWTLPKISSKGCD
jgi:hypothetical protein